MPSKDHYRRVLSAIIVLPNLATTTAKQFAEDAGKVIATMLVALTCLAQNPDTVTIPATTRFALVLTNPVASKSTHRGDVVYAQTTAPVIVGDRAVIPAGIFVQGKVDRLSRNGSHAEMLMNSASIVFPDGYVANIAGPLSVESDEGTAWRDPSSKAGVGAILAPIIGGGAGALIGSAAHTTQSSTLGGTTITSSSPKGVMIGSAVGLAAGITVSLTILLHSRQFFVDVGSPMEMTLPQPLFLTESQVAKVAREVQEHPIAVPMAAPRPLPNANFDHGICFTPGTPGTPSTTIPGTPTVGDIPGTPDVVIPGTPPMPGTPYPTLKK
jgi:hypothetical protein